MRGDAARCGKNYYNNRLLIIITVCLNATAGCISRAIGLAGFINSANGAFHGAAAPFHAGSARISHSNKPTKQGESTIMAGYKGGMGGNMQNIMKQAQKMQEQMQEVDKQLDDWEVVGTSGGGAEGDETVVVYMNAKKIINGIEFGSNLSGTVDLTDEDDVEMLEDLIMAAINDGYKKADEVYEEKMGPFGNMGGLGGLI